jgi:hypothetical protein
LEARRGRKELRRTKTEPRHTTAMMVKREPMGYSPGQTSTMAMVAPAPVNAKASRSLLR